MEGSEQQLWHRCNSWRKRTKKWVRVGLPIMNVHVGALWEALNMKVRSPRKFMDARVVQVPDVNDQHTP